MRIILQDIVKSYQGRLVLNIKNMTFEGGKIYSVLGPNGSGKTTLLRIIAGIEKPDNGKVIIENEGKPSACSIAYLPQKPYIFDMTVIENVMLGLPKRTESESKALESLKKLGMIDYKDTNARALSGGGAQRVALARTLVLDKNIVILDEPASFVDAKSVGLIENYIRSIISDRDSIVIFTTHDLSQSQRIADISVALE